MARKADGNGECGLIALCLVIIFAVGKCGGATDSPPDAQSPLSMIGPDTAAVATSMYVAMATLYCRADPKPGASVIEKLARGELVTADRFHVGKPAPGKFVAPVEVWVTPKAK